MVGPHDNFDDSADIMCVNCGAPSHHVSAHTKNEQNPNKQDIFTPAHFRHNPDEGDSCAGGESDIHIRRKNVALSKAMTEFDCDEERSRTEEFVGDNRADARAVFTETHDTYGRGLAIEYQHKNESKDIEAVTEEYLSEGYTPVWLWEEQFSEDDRDVDLFGGTVVPVWPNAVPEQSEWGGEFDYEPFRRSRIMPYNVSSNHALRAIVPTQITPGKLWGVQFTAAQVTYRMPPEWHDDQAQRIWNETSWEDIFNPPEDYLDIWPYAKVPASLPGEWSADVLREWWDESDWAAKFKFPYNYDRTYGKNHVDATIHLFSWLEQDELFLFKGPLGSSAFQKWGTVDIEDPATPTISGSAEALIPGTYEEQVMKKFRPSRSIDVERPSSPIDDIQCWDCGAYWWYKKDHSECPKCGTPVDWVWNVETYRVSRSSLEELDSNPLS
ncbi:hypothetical protein [Halosimplex sp. TS25]|uniref:hypothetical protein n=1 Tax=Halosimplex rarum TaxID=3396619 RepID=UPI0039ED8902